MGRIGRLARQFGLDLVIALLVAIAMLELLLQSGSPEAPGTTLWVTVPAMAVMALPLLARRRLPFAAPAAFWVLAAGLALVDGQVFAFVESIFLVGVAISFLLGNARDPVDARLGLLVVLGGATVVVFNLPDRGASELVFVPLVFVVAWVAGFALRERAEQAEQAELRAQQAERERETAGRLAVAEERARIARELHDVVAHAVSVMVLQVGAVRHNLPAGLEEDTAALRRVEDAGRTALAEMRRLLGAMRSDGEAAERGPQPGLDGLDALLDDVRGAGLPVRLHVDGEAFPLPRGLDLSAYRIVQEGLTNALRHARASRADVSLGYGRDGLRIEVRDDGQGAAAGDGLGHGLVGVRERVTIYGGEMSAGPAPEGGFVLAARLPLGDRR